MQTVIETPRVRRPHPSGRTEAFVDAVRAKFGDPYVKSWLAGGVNCAFTEDRIYTTGFGAHQLRLDAEKIAERIGVTIHEDPDLRRSFAASQGSVSPKRSPAKRSHGPRLQSGGRWKRDPPALD